MELIFSVILLLIILGMVAAIGLEGTFSAAIMFFNVFIAGLIATAFFEPIAQYLQSLYFGGAFWWDCFILFGLFAGILMLLRTISDKIARQAVRFPKTIDQIGGALFGAATGYLLCMFLTFAVQTAPLDPQPFFNGLKPNQANFFGLTAPGQQWLALTQYSSYGAFAPFIAAEGSTQPDPSTILGHYQRRHELYGSESSVAAGYSGVYSN